MVKFFCKDPDIYQVSKGDLIVDFKKQIAETEDERAIEFLRSFNNVEEITDESINTIESKKGKEDGSKYSSKSAKNK